jgi:hypothetical protein
VNPAMTDIWRWVAAAGAVVCVSSAGVYAQQPVTCGAELKGAERAESARYTVVYRMKPAPVAVSRHFALELAVCPKGGAPAPEALAVDARMPEHGHGMNYQTTVKALGRGRFQADGLMFHMPGRWELVFDVRGGESSERVLGNFTLR